MLIRLLALLGLLVADVAFAGPFTADAVCDNGTSGVWAVGAVELERDPNGVITGGSSFGLCLDGTEPFPAGIVKDGIICKCSPVSGSGKDLFCKVHAVVVDDTTTITSCVKSAKP